MVVFVISPIRPLLIEEVGTKQVVQKISPKLYEAFAKYRANHLWASRAGDVDLRLLLLLRSICFDAVEHLLGPADLHYRQPQLKASSYRPSPLVLSQALLSKAVRSASSSISVRVTTRSPNAEAISSSVL